MDVRSVVGLAFGAVSLVVGAVVGLTSGARSGGFGAAWVASSQQRWRATAAERRLYGGKTVTEFYVFRPEDRNDPSKWLTIKGYGPTPGERKTFAIRRAEELTKGQ